MSTNAISTSKLLSLAQAADLLGLSTRTIRRRIANGQLPAYRSDRKVIRIKMAAAVQLGRLFTPGEVDWALGHAAVHGRFAEADLVSILDHHRQQAARDDEHRTSEDRSLTQGANGWARYCTSKQADQ